MTNTGRRHSYLCASALALLLAGCAGGPNGGSGLPRWTVEEELRIGSPNDPELTLSAVSSLAVDDDGRIYVAQPDQAVIRVFDANGQPMRYIGRRGGEAGQFERVYTIGLLGDTLYAIDLGHRRIEYFSRDGESLRSLRVSPPPVSPPFLPSMPFAVFPDGSRAVGTSSPASVTAEDIRRVPQLRSDSTGIVLDTVAWISYEHTGRRVSYEGRPIGVGSPLSDDAFAVFSEDGSRIVTIDRAVAPGQAAATFGVTLTDGWGDTIFSRRYDYVPVPVDAAVVDSVVAERANAVAAAFPDQREALTFVRGTMFLPAYYPPVSTALFSGGNSLWLKRESVPGQDQTWTILDEAGDPVAEATLPDGLLVMHVRDEGVWGVEYDEAGVPYVVRYGVVR